MKSNRKAACSAYCPNVGAAKAIGSRGGVRIAMEGVKKRNHMKSLWERIVEVIIPQILEKNMLRVVFFGGLVVDPEGGRGVGVFGQFSVRWWLF